MLVHGCVRYPILSRPVHFGGFVDAAEKVRFGKTYFVDGLGYSRSISTTKHRNLGMGEVAYAITLTQAHDISDSVVCRIVIEIRL